MPTKLWEWALFGFIFGASFTIGQAVIRWAGALISKGGA